MQQYIDRNSDCIPLHDLKENFRLLPLIREFTTPRGGCIDLLAADADGEIYIIETKLAKNADKRRIIAQALDYGAAICSIHRSFSRDWKIWIGRIGCWVFWAAMKTHYRIVSRQSSEMPGWVASSLSC